MLAVGMNKNGQVAINIDGTNPDNSARLYANPNQMAPFYP
jgi:hypothetical protein